MVNMTKTHNNALVRMQTTLRFVCTAQLCRYVGDEIDGTTEV